jgi:hypothetical protein
MFDPWNDASVSAFVSLLAEHGEGKAHRRFANSRGADCLNVPEAVAAVPTASAR